MLEAGDLLEGLFRRGEVFLYCLHQGWEYALIKVDDSVEVEFGAEEVEEDVLAVALVKFGDHVGELVEHGEGLRGVGHAGHHLAHALLQLNDLVLQLFVLCLQLVSLLPRIRKLLSHYFQFIFRLRQVLMRLTHTVLRIFEF